MDAPPFASQADVNTIYFSAKYINDMNIKNDIRLSLGLSLIALSTLMAEVLLIRVFEVIFLNNIGYAVITCAMFGFGLAGTYAAIWPMRNDAMCESSLRFFR